MEDKYGLIRNHSGIWRSLRDADFEEEDVWAVINENKKTDNNISGFKNPKDIKESSPLAIPRILPSAARMIPRTSSNNSSASSSHESKVLQQSAPVNIPDWSKIYVNKKNQNKSPKNVKKIYDYGDYYHSLDDEDGGGGCGGFVGYKEETDEDEEEDDEYESTKLPPHEFIARRLQRNHISSFSVFEGVGRTLKGRDLSKVRNAVLTKTGFLESL